jgi:dihydrofolate reductase
MIRAIVACDPTGLIGAGGAILWHYPADFAHFKARTMGGVCVMGRRTFESIPPLRSGEVLPGRRVIVLTRADAGEFHRDLKPGNVGCAPSLRVAIDDADEEPSADVWICGGASVYVEAARLGLFDEIDITEVPRVDGVSWTTPGAVTWWPWHAGPFEAVPPSEVEQPAGFAEAGLRRCVLRRAERTGR